MPPERIQVVLPSRVVWLDALQGLAEDVAARVGLDEDARFAVSMALREGLNNAILHGNRKDESKQVELVFLIDDDRLEIRIKDEGPGFDAGSIPDPLAPHNLLSSHGRGVFLIRSYMDEVDLRRTAEPGGEIRMVKFRPGGRPRGEGKERAGAAGKGERLLGETTRAMARHEVWDMSMKAEVQEIGNVTVVRAKGKITIGEGDVKLRETIEGLLTQGKKNILLDLGNISFMDSSGVGELVGCYTTVMNRGGKLKLLNLTKKIHDLLQVTQLITVFDTYAKESEALESYAK